MRKAKIDTATNSPEIPVLKWKSITFPNVESKARKISSTESELEEIRRERIKYSSELYYDRLEFPLKVGDFGELLSQIQVKKIIDSETMLIEVIFYRVFRHVIGRNLLKERINLLVKNVSTSEAVVDENVELSLVFQITGKQKHETESGVEKIFVLEPIDTKKIEELLPLSIK